MKKLFVSLMLFAATLTMAGAASAVVVAGSTYTVYLQGSASGDAIAPIVVFDSAPAFAERGGLLLTLSESETDLGSGKSLIRLNISANGDLFPIMGESAFLGVGTFADPLDFETPVALYDARVTLRDLVGNILFASDNIAGLAINNPPWDGSLPTQENIFNISEIGGTGVASIAFDFYVTDNIQTDVPEPGSVLLCGAGLLAVFGARRHRRVKA